MITKESLPLSFCEISTLTFRTLLSREILLVTSIWFSVTDYLRIHWVPAWCPTRARSAKSQVTWYPFSCLECRGAHCPPCLSQDNFMCPSPLMSQGLTIYHSTWSFLSLRWMKCFCYLQLVHFFGCLACPRDPWERTVPSPASTPHPSSRCPTPHLSTVNFLNESIFSKDT